MSSLARSLDTKTLGIPKEDLLEIAQGVQVCRKAWEMNDVSSILTKDAVAFLASLHRSSNAERLSLLNARADKQNRYDG